MSSAVYPILLLASLFQLQSMSVYHCGDCDAIFERRTPFAKMARVGFIVLLVWSLLGVILQLLVLAAYLLPR